MVFFKVLFTVSIAIACVYCLAGFLSGLITLEDIPFTNANKQKKLKEEIEKIYIILRSDYLISMIKIDFINRVKSDGSSFSYRLTDGSVIDFTYKDKVLYLTYTSPFLYNDRKYKITNKELIDKFIDKANDIINYSNRIKDIKNAEENRRRKYYEQAAKPKPKQESKPKHSNHPKWSIYQTLVQTVSSRQHHLRTMPKNDPNRQTLENELKAAESKMNLFKQKYGF